MQTPIAVRPGLILGISSLISLKKACKQILPAGGARAILDTPSARQASGVSNDPSPGQVPPDIAKLQSEMNAAVKAHWKAFLFEGIVLAVLGLAAMIVPPLASLAVTIFLGWMFLISGIAGLFVTYWARQMPGFWWSLFSAALAVLAGGILLARPSRASSRSPSWSAPISWPKASPPSCTRWSTAANCRSAGPGCWSPGVMDLLIAFIIVAGLPGSARMGDRPPGRDQSRARRRIAGRHGARRAQILIPRAIMG